MMRTLGMIGFQQSYTYYAWRNAKWELEQYLHELSCDTAHGATSGLLAHHSRHPDPVHELG